MTTSDSKVLKNQILQTLEFVKNNPKQARIRHALYNLIPIPLRFGKYHYNEHFFAVATQLVILGEDKKLGELIERVKGSGEFDTLLSQSNNNLYSLNRNKDNSSEILDIIEYTWHLAQRAYSEKEVELQKKFQNNQYLNLRSFKKSLNRYIYEQNFIKDIEFIKANQPFEEISERIKKKKKKKNIKRSSLFLAFFVAFSEAMISAVAITTFGLSAPVIGFIFILAFVVNATLFYSANQSLLKDFFGKTKIAKIDENGEKYFDSVSNIFIDSNGNEVTKTKKWAMGTLIFFAISAGIASGCLSFNSLMTGLAIILSAAFPPLGLTIIAISLSLVAGVVLTSLFYKALAGIVKDNQKQENIKNWLLDRFVRVWGEKQDDKIKYFYQQDTFAKGLKCFTKGFFSSLLYGGLCVGTPLVIAISLLFVPCALMFQQQMIQTFPILASQGLKPVTLMVTIMTGAVESWFRLEALIYMKDKIISQIKSTIGFFQNLVKNPAETQARLIHQLTTPEMWIMGPVVAATNVAILINGNTQAALQANAGSANSQVINHISPGLISDNIASNIAGGITALSSNGANIGAAEEQIEDNIVTKTINTANLFFKPASLTKSEETPHPSATLGTCS